MIAVLVTSDTRVKSVTDRNKGPFEQIFKVLERL